jgi:hypothetical protein
MKSDSGHNCHAGLENLTWLPGVPLTFTVMATPLLGGAGKSLELLNADALCPLGTCMCNPSAGFDAGVRSVWFAIGNSFLRDELQGGPQNARARKTYNGLVSLFARLRLVLASRVRLMAAS